MTLESFGSLVLVTVTVTRKMFSILLSVVWFGHHLSLGQWCSVGLVFVAIVWESSGKADPPKLKKKEQWFMVLFLFVDSLFLYEHYLRLQLMRNLVL